MFILLHISLLFQAASILSASSLILFGTSPPPYSAVAVRQPGHRAADVDSHSVPPPFSPMVRFMSAYCIISSQSVSRRKKKKKGPRFRHAEPGAPWGPSLLLAPAFLRGLSSSIHSTARSYSLLPAACTFSLFAIFGTITIAAICLVVGTNAATSAKATATSAMADGVHLGGRHRGPWGWSGTP